MKVTSLGRQVSYVETSAIQFNWSQNYALFQKQWHHIRQRVKGPSYLIFTSISQILNAIVYF